MSESLPSPREVLDKLPSHFQPEMAGNARSTVHLELSGDHGGQWTVRVADGACQVLDGLQGTPDLIVQGEGEDYVRIMEGTLMPMEAFLQGRVKFSGDISLALKMQSWFRRPSGRLGELLP